jgi:hypothetical protein
MRTSGERLGATNYFVKLGGSGAIICGWGGGRKGN